MHINRFLLLIIILLSINNHSYAMLRPSILRKLKSIPLLHTQNRTHSTVHPPSQPIARNQLYKNGAFFLVGTAVGSGTLYGILSLQEYLNEASPATTYKLNTEEKELVLFYLSNKERCAHFIQTTINAGIKPHKFVITNEITPLIAACKFGDIDSVKLLIKQGEILIGDKELDAAINYNQTGMTQFLLEHPRLKLDTDENGLPRESFLGRSNESDRLYEAYYLQQKKQKQAEKETEMKQNLISLLKKNKNNTQ